MMLGCADQDLDAQKQGIDPKRLFVVSVMPCKAKKYK
jgi:iron only hydrogenase large subunit-like protein